MFTVTHGRTQTHDAASAIAERAAELRVAGAMLVTAGAIILLGIITAESQRSRLAAPWKAWSRRNSCSSCW